MRIEWFSSWRRNPFERSQLRFRDAYITRKATFVRPILQALWKIFTGKYKTVMILTLYVFKRVTVEIPIENFR